MEKCGKVRKSVKKCRNDFALELLTFSFSLNLAESLMEGPIAFPELGGSQLGRAPKQCPAPMVSGEYCEGVLTDTACWTRLRNTWLFLHEQNLQDGNGYRQLGSNPSWWVRLGQKSQKIPSFTVKKAPNRHPLQPEPPFTGVSGPSGPEIAKKSQKGSFWGSGQKSRKIPEKSLKIPKKCPKRSENRYF